MTYKGKRVAEVLVAFDTEDKPDFSDAYFFSAILEDGTELRDFELDDLTEMYPEVINEIANDLSE